MKRYFRVIQLKDGNVKSFEYIPVHRLLEDFYRVIERWHLGTTPDAVRAELNGGNANA